MYVVKVTPWPLCHRANNSIPIEQEGGSKSGRFGEYKNHLPLQRIQPSEIMHLKKHQQLTPAVTQPGYHQHLLQHLR